MLDVTLALGIMILGGFLARALAHRFKFPMITGYLVVGILFSPSLLNVIPEATIARLEVFTSIALGIIAYAIGTRLRVEQIKKMERSIVWITPLQSLGAWFLTTPLIALVAPFIITAPGATFWGTYFPIALVIGAVVIAIVHEYRARGPLTTTLLSVVALDDGIAIISFAVAVRFAQSLAGVSGDFSWLAILAPFLEIIESLALGAFLSLVLIYLARLVKTRALLLVIVLGTILLAVGISHLIAASAILVNMMVGFVVANRARRAELGLVIDDIEDVIFALFFVLAGLHFDLGAIGSAGLMALLIVLGRFSGKYLGSRLGGQLAHSPVAVRKYLGLALLPKAGVSLGLALLAQRAFPEFGALIFNAVLVSVILNELIALPLARYAIFKAGEETE